MGVRGNDQNNVIDNDINIMIFVYNCFISSCDSDGGGGVVVCQNDSVRTFSRPRHSHHPISQEIGRRQNPHDY